MKVDESITRSTICRYDFSCLSGDKTWKCKVKSSIGHGVVEIKSTINRGCGYRVSFGDTYFCNCPTRNEIYNRYSK